jgi:hypothetical protein
MAVPTFMVVASRMPNPFSLTDEAATARYRAAIARFTQTFSPAEPLTWSPTAVVESDESISLQSLGPELLIVLLKYLDPISTVCFALTSRRNHAITLSAKRQPLKALCPPPNQLDLSLPGSSDFEQLMNLLCFWLPHRHLVAALLNKPRPGLQFRTTANCLAYGYHHNSGTPCLDRLCACHLKQPKFYKDYATAVVRIEEALELITLKESMDPPAREVSAGITKDAVNLRFREVAKMGFWDKARWII